MKRILLGLVAATLVFGLSAARARAATVDVKSVTALCETMEEGEKTVAYAVEYTEPFLAGVPARNAYMVREREISRVYVNDSGLRGDVRYRGRYVIVEVATSNVPGSSVGTTLLWGRMNNIPNRVNHRLPPTAVFVQTRDLTSEAGNVAQSQRLEIGRQINPLVDSFAAFSFTDGKTGMTMNYRLFIPEGYKGGSAGPKLPLVVFLHGSGERGANNMSQLLANPSGLEFARAEAQEKHPCFVLAPQNPDSMQGWSQNTGTDQEPNWVTTDQLETAKRIVDHVAKTYAVDPARIYGTGLSQGSKGTMLIGMNYPGLYAAQINSSGCDQYTDEAVAAVAHKPIWHLIAMDDDTNSSADTRTLMAQFEKAGATVVRRIDERGWDGFKRGAAASALASEQWNEAKGRNSDCLYTEYIAGTVLPGAHWSWMANFSNAVVRDWLFSHTNPTPYVPE